MRSPSLTARRTETSEHVSRVCSAFDISHTGVRILTGEVSVAKVEKEHAEETAVVFVDHAGARVDAVLAGEPGARRDATVVAGGDREADTGLDDLAPSAWHNDLFGRVQVVTRSERRTPRWELGERVGWVALDEQAERGRGGGHGGGGMGEFGGFAGSGFFSAGGSGRDCVDGHEEMSEVRVR